MSALTPDHFQDIRDSVRALCAAFPDACHRQVDAARADPVAFVDALTEAGWLAAMIPQEYGGSGLGLAGASVIMEEINRSGGNAGACHNAYVLRPGLRAVGSRRLTPRLVAGAQPAPWWNWNPVHRGIRSCRWVPSRPAPRRPLPGLHRR